MAIKAVTRDMYDFIGQGKSLYDILGRVGITDFSTTGLICNALKVSGSGDLDEIKFGNQTFDLVFEKITSGIDNVLTTGEQFVTVTDFNNINPRKFNFKTMDECVKYLKDNEHKSVTSVKEKDITRRNVGFEQEYESLLNVVVGSIIKKYEKAIEDKQDPDGSIKNFLLDNRNLIFKGAYYPRINNEIRKRFPNRATIYIEEADLLMYAANTLVDKNKMGQYDDYIGAYNEKIRAYMEKQALAAKLGVKRDRVIASELTLGFTPEQFKRAKEQGIESVLFENKKRRPSREGTFTWSVRELREPKVILDTVAEYTPTGEANQRVVAVSYGKFNYGTMFNRDGNPTIASEALDLFGVTRMGKDGVHTYFVVAPFSELKLKTAAEFVPGVDQERKFMLNGRETEIIDHETQQRLDRLKKDGYSERSSYYRYVKERGIMHMVLTDKIDPSQADYYAKVAFSDRVLEGAIESNHRFAGGVKTTQYGSGITLDSSYTYNPYDIEALMYAQRFPGRIGRRTFENFEAYCKSTELMSKHLGIVRDVTKGEYDFDKQNEDGERV